MVIFHFIILSYIIKLKVKVDSIGSGLLELLLPFVLPSTFFTIKKDESMVKKVSKKGFNIFHGGWLYLSYYLQGNLVKIH